MLLGIGVLVCVVIAGFFLNQTELNVDDLSSFSFEVTMAKILTVKFVLFLVFLGMVGGITGGAIGVLPKNAIHAGTLIGGLVGALIAHIAFDFSFFLIPIVAMLWGLAAGIEAGVSKREEYKSFVPARTAMSVAGTMGTFIAVGLLLWGIVALSPIQNQLSDRFIGSVLNMGLGNMGPDSEVDQLKTALAKNSARVSVQSQTMLLTQIMSTPAFNDLRSNQDQKSRVFVATMEGTLDQVSSSEYLQRFEEEFVKDAQKIEVEVPQVKSTVVDLFNQNPFFKAMMDHLALVVSISLLILFLTLNSLIIRPVGALSGWVFNQAFESLKNAPK
ncbi:MAG: hypothetical protein J4215_02740 [Candidatus Diapherotrites archaeon]|uniref:Uncharacterized protein n=1 Tax=Candidatus Iainarchaeum sp. TaxID=3101447 RepID=A0A8T4LDW2_9ARCH|nr:hypothetical protein [Candidatus Diapherotrites archaeon]